LFESEAVIAILDRCLSNDWRLVGSEVMQDEKSSDEFESD
jgi:hypothetical protein